jgi:hypothetical protein
MANVAPNDLIEDNAGVSSNHVDLQYVPFRDVQKKPKEVDKRIFLPLYATTACMILLSGFLPTSLVAIFVAIWVVVFLGTPIYYLYNYHPDVVDCYQDNSSDYAVETDESQVPARVASV